MTSITRTFEFDAAHRLHLHQGACRNLHGHRYKAEVTVVSKSCLEEDMILDFGTMKQLIGGWIDANWDHTTIVGDEDLDLQRFCQDARLREGCKKPYVIVGQPTVERMVKELAARIQDLMEPMKLRVVEIRMFETPSCSATYRP